MCPSKSISIYFVLFFRNLYFFRQKHDDSDPKKNRYWFVYFIDERERNEFITCFKNSWDIIFQVKLLFIRYFKHLKYSLRRELPVIQKCIFAASHVSRYKDIQYYPKYVVIRTCYYFYLNSVIRVCILFLECMDLLIRALQAIL